MASHRENLESSPGTEYCIVDHSPSGDNQSVPVGPITWTIRTPCHSAELSFEAQVIEIWSQEVEPNGRTTAPTYVENTRQVKKCSAKGCTQRFATANVGWESRVRIVSEGEADDTAFEDVLKGIEAAATGSLAGGRFVQVMTRLSATMSPEFSLSDADARHFNEANARFKAK